MSPIVHGFDSQRWHSAQNNIRFAGWGGEQMQDIYLRPGKSAGFEHVIQELREIGDFEGFDVQTIIRDQFIQTFIQFFYVPFNHLSESLLFLR